MASRLIISSMPAMLSMLENHPELYTIPAFAGVKSLVGPAKSYRPSGCRACGGHLNSSMKYSRTFEGALVALSSTDIAKIKSVLKIDQFCYYVRDAITHKLQLKCQ